MLEQIPYEGMPMGADGTSLSWIKTSQAGLGYDEILRVWREADHVPEFQDAWLWDHLVPLRGDVTGAALEAWTLLAALAAQTVRLRLGVIVTSNRIRPPAVLAKIAATVDVIAAGRLVFGIGAGGSATATRATRNSCIASTTRTESTWCRPTRRWPRWPRPARWSSGYGARRSRSISTGAAISSGRGLRA